MKYFFVVEDELKTKTRMSIEFSLDESVPDGQDFQNWVIKTHMKVHVQLIKYINSKNPKIEEFITEDMRDILFAKKLEEFLHKQNKNYSVKINGKGDSRFYNTHDNCKIIIAADFSCCEWKGSRNGYQECNKCHVKRGCNVSREFDMLVQEHGYKCEFIDSCFAGLFRWDN